MKTHPNLLIIGAQKCGTTALYNALRQHPKIFMSSPKEPGFFAFDGRRLDFQGPLMPHSRFQEPLDWTAYLALFDGAAEYPVRGEASTYYTYCWPEQTANHIHHRLPQARLIALLRQPAERAYSAFGMMRQKRLEPLADFRRALTAERSAVRARWTPDFRYAQNGMYYSCLKPYFDHFPRSQICVYLYEDWNDRPAEILHDICRFLEIDEMFTPAMAARRNVTRLTRSKTLNTLLKRAHPFKALLRPLLPARWRKGLLRRLRRWNERPPLPLDPALRRKLTESYREDILRLQELIGLDLGHWLTDLEPK